MRKREARKVYKSGRGSYILTLPKEWVVMNGLNDGDILNLEIKGGSIILSADNVAKLDKKSIIDDKDLGFNQLVRLIISHYLAGYNQVKIKTYNDEQRRGVAFAVDMLVGAEVMEDTGNEVVVDVFLDPKRFDIINIIERLFNICISMLSDFRGITSNFDPAVCSSIMVRENEVDKIHFLVLRLLNQAMENEDLDLYECVNYRSVVRSLERVADHISSMSEALVNIHSSFPKLASVVEIVEKILKSTMISFLKKDPKIAEEVLKGCETLENRIQKNYEEILNFDAVRVLNLKTVLDSLSRIIAYSTDVAEIVLDLSVYKKS